MVKSRQGVIVTLKELRELIKELEPQAAYNSGCNGENIKFQINIINEEECSDTWKIEKGCPYEYDSELNDVNVSGDEQ